MERAEDTICALATAAAEAGIGIIRISGEHALSVAGSLLRTKSGERLDLSKPNRVRYAFVYDNEEAVDEVLVTSFLAPHSYTGEDSVEISCHGGVLLLQKVLSLRSKRSETGGAGRIYEESFSERKTRSL